MIGIQRIENDLVSVFVQTEVNFLDLIYKENLFLERKEIQIIFDCSKSNEDQRELKFHN